MEGNGDDKEAALNERIEVGLFTAEPGRDAFDSSHVILKRAPQAIIDFRTGAANFLADC